MSELRIRNYQDGDQENVINLILPIQQQEFSISISRDDQPDLAAIPQFYQQGLGNFWVAVDNEDIIGTVALIDIGNQEVALRKMFVSKEHRGTKQGAAARLLQTVFEWAAVRGIRAIYLGTTAKFLAAHRFYEKNGFTRIGPEDLPKTFPLMKVDTVFYRWP